MSSRAALLAREATAFTSGNPQSRAVEYTCGCLAASFRAGILQFATTCIRPSQSAEYAV